MAGSKTGYLTIQNFRFGLDARRSELTSQPGTLLRAVDCHINQGAEIEKRKAIVKTAMPAGVFLGLPGLSTQYAFGSIAAPSMPAGFTYIQLTSPLGSAMSVLVGATLFNNEPFTVATFGADGTFCFYNGLLVEDFISGEVLSGQTTDAEQATSLVTLVNATTNYTAAIGTASNIVIIKGKNAASFTSTDTVTSAVGSVSTHQISTSQAGTTGQQAIGSFTIQAGTAGTGAQLGGIYQVIVTAPGGFPTNIITSGPVNFTTDIPTTAALIAANINAYTLGNLGYSATSSGGTVTLYAPIGSQYNGTIIGVQTNVASNNDGAVILQSCQFIFSPPSPSVDLTISQITDSTGTPIVLTNTSRALSSFANLNALLVQVAKDINANFIIATQPFVAVAVGATLYISRWAENFAPVVGVSPIVLTYTGAGWIIAGTGGLTAGALPKSLTAAGTNGATTGQVQINVAGGTAPYTYAWSVTVAMSPQFFGGPGLTAIVYINSPTSDQTSFFVSVSNTTKTTYSAKATCVVTDSAGNTTAVIVPIAFNISNT